MIKLFVTDLDGTFVATDNTISKANMDVVARAKADGVHFVAATGRNLCELPKVLRESDVRYFVSCNGGYIFDALEKKVLFSRGIPCECAVSALNAAYKHGAIINMHVGDRVYGLDNFYIGRQITDNHVFFEFLDECCTKCASIEELVEKAKNAQTINKIALFFVTDEARDAALAEIVKKEELDISSSYKHNLELNAKGVNKGEGLNFMMKLLGVSPNELVTIGDSENDLSMMGITPHSFAVANACEAVKRAASCIVPSNNDDGVAAVYDMLPFLSV